MPRQSQKINVVVTFSEGWQERFTKAAYELWLSCKSEEITNKTKEKEESN